MNRLSIAVNVNDHLQGSLDAPRVLVQYGDYECSACGAAFPIVKRLQEHLGDKLSFVYRNFPLREAHPHAEHAAETAEFAAAHGNFWEMHDLLYENQENLEDESLCEFAVALGLSPNKLRRSLEAGSYRDRIDNDFRGGVRSGVNGTPTFFINGLRYDGSYDFDGLLGAIVQR
jgi:protein-disulfide isomerase